MNVKLTDLMNAGDAGETFSLTAKGTKQGHKIGKSFGKPDGSAKKGMSTVPDFQSQLQQQMKMGSENENNSLEQSIPQQPVALQRQNFEGAELLTRAQHQRPPVQSTSSNDGKESFVKHPKKPDLVDPNQAEQLTFPISAQMTGAGKTPMTNSVTVQMPTSIKEQTTNSITAQTTSPGAEKNVMELPLPQSTKALPGAKPVRDEKPSLAVNSGDHGARPENTQNVEKAPVKDRLNELAFLSHAPTSPSAVQPMTKATTLNDKNRDEREINIESATHSSTNLRPITPEMTPMSPAPSSAPTTFVEPSKEVAQLVSTLPPQAMEDASLRAAVHPNVANISIDTGEAGALSVRLMVKDGVADVQLTGPAAPVIENRESELRVVLAQEGLSLGQFDSPQRDNSQQQRFDRDELPSRPSTPTSSQTTTRAAETAPRANNGRVHIKA